MGPGRASSLVLVWLAACGPAADSGRSPDPCAAAFYLDGDDDGHGDATVWTTACDAPSGYVAAADDCDDTNVSAHPGAPELCNGVDDDCDGAIDVDAVDAVTRYADADADGFGDDALTGCSVPDGFVAVGGD